MLSLEQREAVSPCKSILWPEISRRAVENAREDPFVKFGRIVTRDCAVASRFSWWSVANGMNSLHRC